MPERVKKVEGQLDVLCTDLETMKTDIRQIIDALSRLCSLEGSQQGPNSPGDSVKVMTRSHCIFQKRGVSVFGTLVSKYPLSCSLCMCLFRW